MRIKLRLSLSLLILFCLSAKLPTPFAFKVDVGIDVASADEDAANVAPPRRAPQGGNLQPYENGYIEVVRKSKFIKIYVYDKRMKSQKKMSDFSITADALLPSVKDAAPLKVSPAKGYFKTEFEAGAAPSFELDIGIVDHRNKHADRIRFSIETRKI